MIGGISNHSLNHRLFNEMKALSEDRFQFQHFDISTLPFFSQDIENEDIKEVYALRTLALESDAVLILTPEYNRSFPGVLKNALDWGSRPYGKNCWNNKPTAIAGASTGMIATFGAQQQLRLVCSFLNMHVMSQPEFYFNASLNLIDNVLIDKASAMIQQFLDSFEKWIVFCNKN
jgi:chromate reductase